MTSVRRSAKGVEAGLQKVASRGGAEGPCQEPSEAGRNDLCGRQPSRGPRAYTARACDQLAERSLDTVAGRALVASARFPFDKRLAHEASDPIM